MEKVISLFKRDYEGTRKVYDEIVEGAEWVVAGEGRATEKIDGTSCMVRDGRLFKRFDAKKGKTPPAGFEAAQDPDPNTGHWPGWVPVGDGPEDKWHRAASLGGLEDGTYELVGPKVQGNKHQMWMHSLIKHGDSICADGDMDDCPRDFDGIKAYLERNVALEGIVWHHPDGRMVKIKRRDFGLPW